MTTLKDKRMARAMIKVREDAYQSSQKKKRRRATIMKVTKDPEVLQRLQVENSKFHRERDSWNDIANKHAKREHELEARLREIVRFDPIHCPKCKVPFETDSNKPFAWCPKCGYEPGNDKSWVIKRQWQIIYKEKAAVKEQKALVRSLHASWKHERARVEVIAIAAEKANLDLMKGISLLTSPKGELNEAVNILTKMMIPGLREERGEFDKLIVGIAAERDRWHGYYDALMVKYRELEVAFENERQEAMVQAVTIERLGKELTVIKDIINNDLCPTCAHFVKKYIARDIEAKPSDDEYKGDGSDQQDLDDGGILSHLQHEKEPAPMTIKQIETLFQSEDGRLQIAIYIARLEEKVARLEAENAKLQKEQTVYIATAPGRDGAMAKLHSRIAELGQAITDLDATKRHLLKEYERAEKEHKQYVDYLKAIMKEQQEKIEAKDAPEEAPTDAPEPRWMKIWFDDDACLIWEGKNLKPSEIVLMAAALQEHALKMMDGCCSKCGYCADDCHCPKDEELRCANCGFVVPALDFHMAIDNTQRTYYTCFKVDSPSPAKPVDEIALLKRILIRYHHNEPFTAQEAQYILDTVRAARRQE